MRIPRFISSLSDSASTPEVEQGRAGASLPRGTLLYLSDTDLHHLKNVIRLGIGGEVEVFVKELEKSFLCSLVSTSSGGICAQVSKALPQSSLSSLNVLVAFVKPSVCDFITEKCVEAGASSIHFFAAERSQNRLSEEKRQNKLARFERIRDAAIKQSRTLLYPNIELHTSLSEMLAKIDAQSKAPEENSSVWKLLLQAPFPLETSPQESGQVRDNTEIPNILAWHRQSQERGLENIAECVECKVSVESYVLLGPEGGFTRSEVELSRGYGYTGVSLGPNVLRTETAALLACGIIRLLQAETGK